MVQHAQLSQKLPSGGASRDRKFIFTFISNNSYFDTIDTLKSILNQKYLWCSPANLSCTQKPVKSAFTTSKPTKAGMEMFILGISQNIKIVVIKIQKAYGGLMSGDAAEAEQYAHI